MAGSIYQWSKRLSNRTLGWFTGWIYFWAGVVTVTAVAATVAARASTIYPDADQARRSVADPPASTCSRSSAWSTLVTTTLINVFGVRLLAIINNIGVGAEILGMLVFALILLFFANHQPVVGPVRHVVHDATSPTATTCRSSRVGMFMALFVVYGFDTAGTFGEETHRREPPGAARRPVGDLALGHRRRDLPAGGHPVVQGHGRRDGDGQAFGFPIATRSRRTSRSRSAGITLGDLYLFVILIAVYVCTLAIQGATTRLMFSMGRDRRLPLGGAWGQVNPTRSRPRPTPRSRSACSPRSRSSSPVPAAAIYIAIGATGMIYSRYFLCNLGVLAARRRGWPHQKAWFRLGRWGTIINILALIWGGVHDHQHRPLDDPSLFGDFGSDLRNTWSNPFINTFIKIGGDASRRPAGLADLRDAGRHGPDRRRASTTSIAQRGKRMRSRSRPTSRPARPPSASTRPSPQAVA